MKVTQESFKMYTTAVISASEVPSVGGGGGLTVSSIEWRKKFFEKELGIKPGQTFKVSSINTDGINIATNTYSDSLKAHGWMYPKKLQHSIDHFVITYDKPIKELKMADKESVKVLKECIDLQLSKSDDYQNPNSNVVQAMHYRRGVDTIHDIMAQKMLRAQSILESNRDPNFESLEDTYKDLINYASFAVSYMRGQMDGQSKDRDMFNRKINE